MRVLLPAVVLLGCGGAEPPLPRIEHTSSEPPAPDLTTDRGLLEYVLVVEELAAVAVEGLDCEQTGRDLLAVIARKRDAIRAYDRAEDELAEMTEGNDLLHLRRQTAIRDIVNSWDGCADDPTWDAMYRIVFLGE